MRRVFNETLVTVEENDESQAEEGSGGKISSSFSSSKQIADPVVYKLVRVEGDGRLVPATDDEVMEVEDLLEDDKSELPSVADTGQTDGYISNEVLSSGKANLDESEGLSQSENTEVDAKKLNARLEETVPSLSPRLNDSHTNQSGSVEGCLKPADAPINNGSSTSAICTSSKPNFSLLKGEICLDNLSIRELQETFKATFGRETSAKDKLWLKRRIAMGLTNSCHVSTMTFIIKDKILIKKFAEESGKSADGTLPRDQVIGVINDHCSDSPGSPSNLLEDQQLVSGKRLRKPKVEYDSKSEDLHTEQRAAKRVRKPTRRYIEELSEVELIECSGRLVSSVSNSGNGQSSPKSRVRPAQSISSDATAVVTRQDSLGGSGVQVPYVSRVRRGRPRKNFMALMKYHPTGMGIAAKLVKKALGVRTSRSDNQSGHKIWKARSVSRLIQQPKIDETEKLDLVTFTGEQQQDMELKNLDSSGNNSDDNIVTVPTAKGGTRRKHHRAWTLCEVMKLVEGVSRYGAGRWSEIKRLDFASYSYRTSVDLKMKGSRKHASMPIPASILVRVRELAEQHAQAAPSLSSSKLASRSGRSVHETRSGYL
ncbi:hypothetical protein HHK36_021800 [Tetracentron sinense]|uniref:Uncharacterized protein n=1 Tax=Tetracentron sinense TaxID=13715 RepID=A0A835D866_TETSI|nr:hypothetical protein HHK36_021800 [Tetracentron sinense]